MKLTKAQEDWLAVHRDYTPIGQPRADVCFASFGTLYADGSYAEASPGKAILLRPGCIGVGLAALKGSGNG